MLPMKEPPHLLLRMLLVEMLTLLLHTWSSFPTVVKCLQYNIQCWWEAGDRALPTEHPTWWRSSLTHLPGLSSSFLIPFIIPWLFGPSRQLQIHIELSSLKGGTVSHGVRIHFFSFRIINDCVVFWSIIKKFNIVVELGTERRDWSL